MTDHRAVPAVDETTAPDLPWDRIRAAQAEAPTEPVGPGRPVGDVFAEHLEPARALMPPEVRRDLALRRARERREGRHA